MKISRKIIVSGLVQGVWFRNFVANSAKRYSIKGWVRNTSDGNVELLAHGSSKNLDQLERALWTGPPLSKVKVVRGMQVEETPPFSGFKILW